MQENILTLKYYFNCTIPHDNKILMGFIFFEICRFLGGVQILWNYHISLLIQKQNKITRNQNTHVFHFLCVSLISFKFKFLYDLLISLRFSNFFTIFKFHQSKHSLIKQLIHVVSLIV